MKKNHGLALSMVLGLVSLCLLGCGSSEGGGGGGPTGPNPVTRFDPDSPAAGTAITLRDGGSSGDKLIVELYAKDVTRLAGVTFNLNFPATLVRFKDVSRGTFLPGATLTVNGVSGALSIDYAGFGLQSATGSGVLLRFEFDLLRVNTNGRIDIVNPEAENPEGNLLQIAWISGRFVYTQ